MGRRKAEGFRLFLFLLFFFNTPPPKTGFPGCPGTRCHSVSQAGLNSEIACHSSQVCASTSTTGLKGQALSTEIHGVLEAIHSGQACALMGFDLFL